MTKILITGSEGLIGTRLIHALEDLGLQTKRFDIKFPSQHPNHGNILNRDDITHAIKGCEGVIHLAAVSRVIFGEKNPELCWKINVDGAKNVFDIAANTPQIKWGILSSSREVYGQQSRFPVKPDAEYRPINVYAKTKVEAEKYVLSMKALGLNTTVARFSSVYGSVNDYSDRVVPAFCRAAVLGETLHLDGPKNIFDFTHLDDTVSGILNMVHHLINGKEIPPLHFTTGVPTSLQELAKLAWTAAGRGKNWPSIIEKEGHFFDVTKFYGDTQEVADILNWKPTISIAAGVQKLVAEFKQIL